MTHVNILLHILLVSETQTDRQNKFVVDDHKVLSEIGTLNKGKKASFLTKIKYFWKILEEN